MQLLNVIKISLGGNFQVKNQFVLAIWYPLLSLKFNVLAFFIGIVIDAENFFLDYSEICGWVEGSSKYVLFI